MKLKKWDVFREQKAQYLEFATNLVKKRNRIKRWIIQIKLWNTFPHLVANYEQW